MSMRAPLAKVRGTGSAKSGVHHWWAQKLTSLLLVPLFLWFVASMISVATADYATAVAWLKSPLNSSFMVILIGGTFYHAQLGMQVVFEDYVSTQWLRTTSIILFRFLALLLAVISIVAVLSTAWGS